jgi:hypothetical protein
MDLVGLKPHGNSRAIGEGLDSQATVRDREYKEAWREEDSDQTDRKGEHGNRKFPRENDAREVGLAGALSLK